jgi:hypothetical protein
MAPHRLFAFACTASAVAVIMLQLVRVAGLLQVVRALRVLCCNTHGGFVYKVLPACTPCTCRKGQGELQQQCLQWPALWGTAHVAGGIV